VSEAGLSNIDMATSTSPAARQLAMNSSVLTISVVVLTTTNVTYRPTATHLRHGVVVAAAAGPSTSTTLIAAVA